MNSLSTKINKLISQPIRDDFDALFEDVGYLTTLKKKAAYHGCIFENLGDKILVDVIRKTFSNKIFVYSKSHTGRLLRIIGKMPPTFTMSILGGGTLINAGQGYLDLALKCKAQRRIVFGTGVSDPEFWNTINNSYSDIPAWVNYLNSCDYIGVRGPISASILRNWGVTKEVKVIGDPALLYADSNIVLKSCNKKLGFNAGVALGNLWGRDEKELANFYKRFLKHMLSLGWDIKFFPVWEGDHEFLRDIVTSIGLSPQKVMVSNFLNVNHFLNELRTVDLFIGQKLHSVILAACTYTPHVMIEYQPKCRDYMESIGMGQYNLRCDLLNLDQLVQLIHSMYTRVHYLQQQYYIEINKLKNILIHESNHILSMYT